MKSAIAVAAIALTGVIAGVAFGQVTQADAGPDPNLRVLQRIDRKLSSIDTKLGTSVLGSSVLSQLHNIQANTWGTCKAVDGPGCRLGY